MRRTLFFLASAALLNAAQVNVVNNCKENLHLITVQLPQNEIFLDVPKEGEVLESGANLLFDVENDRWGGSIKTSKGNGAVLFMNSLHAERLVNAYRTAWTAADVGVEIKPNFEGCDTLTCTGENLDICASTKKYQKLKVCQDDITVTFCPGAPVTPAVLPVATPAATPAVLPAATPAVLPAATPAILPAATGMTAEQAMAKMSEIQKVEDKLTTKKQHLEDIIEDLKREVTTGVTSDVEKLKADFTDDTEEDKGMVALLTRSSTRLADFMKNKSQSRKALREKNQAQVQTDIDFATKVVPTIEAKIKSLVDELSKVKKIAYA